MDIEIAKKWLALPLLLLAANYMQCYYCVHGKPQVPGVFIFGNSLSDSGNNNNLPNGFKANYRPYGIDFPLGPTGRFTNGRNAIDFITQFLGFEDFIPPFANTSRSDILKGVNYASGGAGIRLESGSNLGARISLEFQLINHRTIVSRIATKLGGFDKAIEYLTKCLYYVNIGSNDYINNYFLPQFYPTSHIYTVEEYTQILINSLSFQLQALHDVGARKYVLVGLGLIGCIPKVISTAGVNGSCVPEQNAAAFLFNSKLKSLVDQFNTKYSADSKFIFINSTALTLDRSLGFTVTNAPCCLTRANGLCVPNQTPPKNRTRYVFYDEFHQTEAANRFIALGSYNASNPALTYPMNIKHLVHQSS